MAAERRLRCPSAACRVQDRRHGLEGGVVDRVGVRGTRWSAPRGRRSSGSAPRRCCRPGRAACRPGTRRGSGPPPAAALGAARRAVGPAVRARRTDRGGRGQHGQRARPRAHPPNVERRSDVGAQRRASSRSALAAAPPPAPRSRCARRAAGLRHHEREVFGGSPAQVEVRPTASIRPFTATARSRSRAAPAAAQVPGDLRPAPRPTLRPHVAQGSSPSTSVAPQPRRPGGARRRPACRSGRGAGRCPCRARRCSPSRTGAAAARTTARRRASQRLAGDVHDRARSRASLSDHPAPPRVIGPKAECPSAR